MILGAVILAVILAAVIGMARKTATARAGTRQGYQTIRRAPADRNPEGAIVSTSHHGRRPAVKAASAAGGVVAFIAVCEAAHVVSVLAGRSGVIAGGAVIAAVFAACWYVTRVRPLLRAARPAPVRLPEPATDLPEPARAL